jgi:CRISPR system Cascade subunit CasC
MFIQIHVLQSLPPGNLNRDDTGQPKKCIFGGVTRGRISSQCLKRHIRHSLQFKEAFGDPLDRTVRTTYLPRMVADEIKKIKPEISEDDLSKLKAALASKFKAEKKGKGESDDAGENEEGQESAKGAPTTDQTGQLVFFPPPFAKSIADLLVKFKTEHPDAYDLFIGEGKKKLSDKEKNKLNDIIKEHFIKPAEAASKSLTVDIGMFGRMTTSDLVVNVEAACQVAHAISTHETIIESDYFTAMDDKKAEFASTQTERTGAGFLSSDATYFNSAVYYKYFNLDTEALKNHLGKNDLAAQAAGVLVRAAACVNPTGKQNSFAAHGFPELILIEVSKAKNPISYANAFLQPVSGRDLMAESAKALSAYVNTVAKAFTPEGMCRVLLAVGSASVNIDGAERVYTLDALVNSVIGLLPQEGAV